MGYIVLHKPPAESKAGLLYNLPFTKVEVIKEGESQRVKVTCDIWVTKEHLIGWWSNEFTHSEILNDCADKILAMHGLTAYEVVNQ